MPELQLPPAMSALRSDLGVMVEGVEAHASYGAVLLSAQQGLQIQIDDREERVIESPPSAGVARQESTQEEHLRARVRSAASRRLDPDGLRHRTEALGR